MLVILLVVLVVWLLPEKQPVSSGGSPTATTTLADRTTVAPSPGVPQATATEQATSTPQGASFQEPVIPSLQQLMFRLVNEDRRKQGLTEIAWDNTAAQAGLRHAQNMARYSYLSHWDLDGHGPDYRYVQAGGLDNVRENVFMYQHSGPGPASPEAWQDLVRDAQQSLMESPGHRDNILAPAHTHVGIGIAYDASQRWFAIAQEFVDRYVRLNPLPLNKRVGEEIMVSGQVLSGATNPLLNMAYEPLPSAMSVVELGKTSTYSSSAEVYETMLFTLDEAGQFNQAVKLDMNGQAGLYHVRIWVDTPAFGQIMASDIVIEVH